MTPSEIELLKILADGEMHSGQFLAETIGVSRTAIWKQLKKIRETNVEITSVRGQGYQLAQPLELLDENTIIEHLRPDIQNQLTSLRLYYKTTSTNKILLDRMDDKTINGHVVIAEYQSEGRGRGGNKWLSGLGAGLYLSLGWHFDHLPKTFSALSLATGVVLAKCIEQVCGAIIQLKWPNDLVYDLSKLGGILIESRGQHAGMADVVIGIGINVKLSHRLSAQIPQATADLTGISGYQPSRNLLAGVIINNVIDLLTNYPNQGFDYYIDKWRELDICRGKQALLQFANKKIEGTVVDIDEQGNLLMSIAGKVVRYSSGDLSLRLVN
jgi:BirA family transcriptional regulator, biotin operon repressor / biotin---[acetyl-CoA-carboxylase] ligase